MSRLEFNHIAWSKTEPPLRRFDLADSAVATPDLEALGLPHQAILPRAGHRAMIEALEAALAERYAAPGGRVLATAGASEANACVYAALLGSGDEVLVESPGYEPHRALAGMFGIRLSRFSRARERAFGGFVERVESSLGPATRMVVVSHIHNPSGAALEPADIEGLERLAEAKGLWILCDETFRDAWEAPLGTLARRGPKWIATSSLTKAYGLGGLRIGWVSGSRETLDRCAAAQNGLSANPAHPSVALTLDLMPHLDALLARSRAILTENHARWNAGVGRRRAAVNGAPFDPGVPPLGTTVWCRFGADGAGDAFSERAAREFDLAVAPGRFFGDSGGIRIGLGTEPERFGPALEQLERALGDFVPAGASSGARE